MTAGYLQVRENREMLENEIDFYTQLRYEQIINRIQYTKLWQYAYT